MFYREYKGIWFKYEEDRDYWVLSDTQEGYANVSYYSGSVHRWDQAYNHFAERLKEHYKVYPLYKVSENKCDEEFWKDFVDKWNKGLKEGSTGWATLKKEL